MQGRRSWTKVGLCLTFLCAIPESTLVSLNRDYSIDSDWIHLNLCVNDSFSVVSLTARFNEDYSAAASHKCGFSAEAQVDSIRVG